MYCSPALRGPAVVHNNKRRSLVMEHSNPLTKNVRGISHLFNSFSFSNMLRSVRQMVRGEMEIYPCSAALVSIS